jgi:hypothetical protein
MAFFLVESRLVDRVSAYRDNYRIEFLKLRIVFCELAEFEAAVRSPVSLIEVEQYVMPGELGKAEGAAIRRRKRKLRRLLADLYMQG